MHAIRFFTISSFLILFIACGGSNQKASSLFDIQLQGNKKKIKQNEVIGLSITNKKNIIIDKITYSIDGKELKIIDDKTKLSVETLGNKVINATLYYDGTSVEISKKIKVLSANAPEIYTYEIINEYPHDTNAYTQGLEFHNDTLYESTGKKGSSSLRKIDYKTGEVLQQIDLDNTIFGEGITIFNEKVYQLSWQNKIGFIYDLKDFKKIDNFQYGESKEGWGLAHDEYKIFKSDGTEKIWFLNPDTMVEEGYIETVTNTSIFNKANELEYVDGKLYANVYQKPSVMIIDATSGAIEGVINFSGLSKKITKDKNWIANESVLNGVAYHTTKKTFFVTGKNWNKLFEVKIIKK